MRTRHTFTATIVVALLAIAGVTAAVAADPPPPRIAFVANGRVPADALAAGPTAGQLGAPIYTTEQDSLPTATADALEAHNPELVIVLGGTVAITDAVVTQISAVTGLPAVDPSPPPTTGVVRAAGADRFATAAAIGDLLGDYNPAALPADGTAVDSDLLDGKDSSAFLGAGAKAADSDKLDGMDSAAFLGAGAKAADSDLLDGKDSSAFLGAGAKAADADKLDGTDSSGFETKGSFTHNALGLWQLNSSAGTQVQHFTDTDRLLSSSQVSSPFPTVHNGDELALDSVRICVENGGGNINTVSVRIYETDATGSVTSDVTNFSWDQGGNGCQVFDITPTLLSGTPMNQDNRAIVYMGVSGQVDVTATTFHFFRPINIIIPFSGSKAAAAGDA